VCSRADEAGRGARQGAAPLRGDPPQKPAARAPTVLALTVALSAGGCVPTLWQPGGGTHLDALAEGARHHAHGRDAEAADERGPSGSGNVTGAPAGRQKTRAACAQAELA
jgi:hypothetical protein